MSRPFAELTTLRVGGPPARIVEPESTEDLVSAAADVWSTSADWLVLGGGSNLVVGDEGFDGTVIRVRPSGVQQIPGAAAGSTRLRAEAGENWDALVVYALEKGLAGIEALSGIPGSCGAAPMQNIGAYGQELSDTLVAIDFLDHATGERMRLDATDLELGYRTSQLKRGRRGIVLAIELDLSNTDGVSAPVRYEQLASALGVAAGDRVPLGRLREHVLSLRAAKGMLLDPRDPDSASAGSFFTNPIVDENFARSLPGDVPSWPMQADAEDRVVPLGEEPAAPAPAEQRQVKLSAAWLIENAGISRGFRLPGSRAAISSKHTLALTNTGGATAAEIAELARYVQTRVLSEFGVLLQPEPVLVGVHL